MRWSLVRRSWSLGCGLEGESFSWLLAFLLFQITTMSTAFFHYPLSDLPCLPWSYLTKDYNH